MPTPKDRSDMIFPVVACRRRRIRPSDYKQPGARAKPERRKHYENAVSVCKRFVVARYVGRCPYCGEIHSWGPHSQPQMCLNPKNQDEWQMVICVVDPENSGVAEKDQAMMSKCYAY